jgi:hypothetical protein
MSKQSDDQEWAAAAIAAAALRGEIVWRDKNRAQNSRDFDIILSDITVAFEVTSTTVEEVMIQWAQVGHQKWESSTRFSWSILGASAQRGAFGADLRDVSEIESYLRIVEDEGVQSFGSHQSSPPSAAARQAVADLLAANILQGYCHGEPAVGTKPHVLFGTVGPGGFLGDGSVLVETLEAVARGNVEKLLKSDSDHRHLFVWVPWSDNEGVVAMGPNGRLPHACPSLPDGVDVIWTALWLPGTVLPTQTPIWRVQPPSPWELVSFRTADYWDALLKAESSPENRGAQALARLLSHSGKRMSVDGQRDRRGRMPQ